MVEVKQELAICVWVWLAYPYMGLILVRISCVQSESTEGKSSREAALSLVLL